MFFSTTVDLGEIRGAGRFQFEKGSSMVMESSTKDNLSELISSMITVLTVVGGIAFVVYFSVGALKWITAGGDKGKVAEAQSQMTQGAIGLIALVASYFVVGIVGGVLGLDILNPFKSLGF